MLGGARLLSEAKAVNRVNSVIYDYRHVTNRKLVVVGVSVTWYCVIAKLLPEDHGEQCSNAQQRNQSSQDGHERVRHFGMMLAQIFHVAAMLKGGQDQRDDSDHDHQRRILARTEKPALPGRLLIVEILKEFVDGEAEADERRRGPDPGHQRAIVSQARPVRR